MSAHRRLGTAQIPRHIGGRDILHVAQNQRCTFALGKMPQSAKQSVPGSPASASCSGSGDCDRSTATGEASTDSRLLATRCLRRRKSSAVLVATRNSQWEVFSVFLCDYLRLESLRREIHEGLQVIENWNSANDFILYGKGGEFTSNRLENQEVLMLSLHLLQVSLVYVNTLMVQQVLAEPDWRNRLTPVDLRALSPLKWQHINPYGTFTLNMSERLPLA